MSSSPAQARIDPDDANSEFGAITVDRCKAAKTDACGYWAFACIAIFAPSLLSNPPALTHPKGQPRQVADNAWIAISKNGRKGRKDAKFKRQWHSSIAAILRAIAQWAQGRTALPPRGAIRTITVLASLPKTGTPLNRSSEASQRDQSRVY